MPALYLGPKHILSFEEIMRHYNVWHLAHAIAFLQSVQQFSEFKSDVVVISVTDEQRVPDERMNNYYVPMLKFCEGECKQLELSCALARFPHFNEEIRRGITWDELKHQVKILHEAIHADLCYRRFAYVPSAKGALHDGFGSGWEEIWTKFPESKEDSQHAIDCYALEQNTACVFHFMRVAEVGLRNIAKNVGVKLTDKRKPMPIEFATWDKVINGIKSKLIQAHALSRSVRKNERLRFYSDAADQCTYFRDLWRNDTAHTRKHYDEGEALSVMNRIREFMHLLSKSR